MLKLLHVYKRFEMVAISQNLLSTVTLKLSAALLALVVKKISVAVNGQFWFLRTVVRIMPHVAEYIMQTRAEVYEPLRAQVVVVRMKLSTR